MTTSIRQELSELPTPEMQFSEHLADSLDFDREDLMLNRQGRMTEKQIEDKLRAFSSARSTDSLLLAIALFTGLLVAGMMANNGGLWMVAGSIIAILIVLFVVSGIQNANTIRRELETGVVGYSMGAISVNIVDRAPIISIGDNVYNTSFGMMRPRYTKAARAFTNEEAYILYHLPESRIIISAEPLELE